MPKHGKPEARRSGGLCWSAYCKALDVEPWYVRRFRNHSSVLASEVCMCHFISSSAASSTLPAPSNYPYVPPHTDFKSDIESVVFGRS